MADDTYDNTSINSSILAVSSGPPTFDQDLINATILNITRWTYDINCTDPAGVILQYTINDSAFSIFDHLNFNKICQMFFRFTQRGIPVSR
jgi:hypothetical protein